jgi:hypothetical protein
MIGELFFMRHQIVTRLVAMAVLVAIASHVGAQLTDQQAAAAKAAGEAGRARDIVVLCLSSKFKESLGHPDLTLVEMRISGAAGDIAMKAFDAKRSSQPIEIKEEARAWHLTVVAHPTRSGVVQAIALRAGKGDAVAADQFVAGPPVGKSVDGAAVFTSPAARALIEHGPFSVVAVLPGGERSCDLTDKDRAKLGL